MDPEVLAVFTTVGADLKSAVLTIAPIALGVGALSLVISKGWGTVKRFSR